MIDPLAWSYVEAFFTQASFVGFDFFVAVLLTIHLNAFITNFLRIGASTAHLRNKTQEDIQDGRKGKEKGKDAREKTQKNR
jgi:hypothetical protein